MGFPDRGEENLLRQTSRCKNFQPNMFNKTKCQNCFRTREAHDLGDDDGSNKPKKIIQCGYLFIAPGLDFDNPMARNRKWQRRCFIFYENGELCYALDDDPSTIPQGVVNMYQCTNVFNADKLTGHSFSMGIATPDETTYIRAETREEKDGWYETLVEYPELNKAAKKQKKKKRGIFPLSKDSKKEDKIEEQAEAKPDLPETKDDPASKLSEMDHELIMESRDEVGPVGNANDILGSTARDTTDIYTASSKAARKEKSNLRRSHSALEHRPEKYEKKQSSRRTISSSTSNTTNNISEEHEKINRRHTTSGKTETTTDSTNEVFDSENASVKESVKESSRRPLSDGSTYKYTSGVSMRSRPSESGLADLERELRQSESVTKSHRESLPAQQSSTESALHRNNNNVYKDISPRSSPTHQGSSRKSSLSERSTSPSETVSTTTTDSQTKKQPSKSDTNAQNLLSQEELQRMDVPKRGRFRLNKALIEGESQSPSKRTIERRRHAQERRGRHTLDGSMVPFPISEQKRRNSESPPRLKRSSSDPNLADNEDLKRKEIAETFPGLLHLKNGWLMMKDAGQEDWTKYWFVLRDNKLRYYNNSSDEDLHNLAGVIDLVQCTEASETTASRNYGFQIKMVGEEVHRLGAMTSGIRTNWIQAINKAIATARQEANMEPAITDTTIIPTETTSTQQAPTPDIISTTTSSTQDSTESPRASLTVDLTARHRKNSADSRTGEMASPTEKEPTLHDRQGSMRSKGRRSRRSSRGDDLKTPKQQIIPKSPVNGRSSSTSSEVFETPLSSPVPVELRIEEPVRRLSSSRSDRSPVEEKVVALDEPVVEAERTEVDSLKTQLEQQQVDNVNLHTENIQLRSAIGVLQKQQSLENDNEQKSPYVTQMDNVVKKLNQVELHNQTLQMEVKQARNASELIKHEKEELQEKLSNVENALEKRGRECETIQSRFEKLVSDFQESEKEVSKARTSLKSERDKAVTMIERLSQQIEVLEVDVKEHKEKLKKSENDISNRNKHIRQLEKNQEESQEVIGKLLAKMEGYKQRLETKGDDGAVNKEMFQKLEQQQRELQAENAELKTRLNNMETELVTKAEALELSQQQQNKAELENELETELAEMRMELSEKDEQIEQLSEQLEAEFSERSELQNKFDSVVAESAQFVLEGQGDKAPSSNMMPEEIEKRLEDAKASMEALKRQLVGEASQRKQAEQKLGGEVTERQKLENHIHQLMEQLRIASEEREEAAHAQSDMKNLMELLQGKNKEVERLQTDMRKMESERAALSEQSKKFEADLETLKSQLKVHEEAKSTLEGDLECVLQSKLDLEESSKAMALELATVKSELELLREATKSSENSATQDQAVREAAEKEVRLLRAQVENVQKMYTEDMFKKEQLLAEEHEKYADVERKLTGLQSKVTEKEEELAKVEKESGGKILELTQQVEQLGQKTERGDRELKRLRNELKSSQDNYDALELKHMQSADEAKQQQKSQQEQLELMGRRIQDLTNKLGSAERKHQSSDELLVAQQRSHMAAMEELQRTHREEMEKKEAEGKEEKEKEEDAVTTTIAALKRTYEEELEKERRLSKDSSSKDVESIMRRHREVVAQMNKDWLILSQKFSEQCKENSMLSKALRAMQRSQKDAHEKLQRAQVENRQKVSLIGEELSKLSSGEKDTGGKGDASEDARLMQIHLKLREVELDFAREEIEILRQSVEGGHAAEGQGTSGDQAGAGEKSRRGSWTTSPESDGSTRPKSKRSLSDLTQRFYKSKKGDKK